MFNWFKKKKKEEKPVEIPKKMDFTKYKMKLTIKSICMFEKLADKSFYKFEEDDALVLMYCVFVCSNGLVFNLSTFPYLLEDARVAKWLSAEFTKLLDFIGQFRKEVEDTQADSGETKDITITSIANSLIVQYGVDAHYVMEEMGLWEIEPFYEAAESMVHEKYEEQRLWTYLSMLPHIDGKKLNKPEKLLPFPWEAENRKKKAEEELKNNQYAIKNLIGRKLDFIK